MGFSFHFVASNDPVGSSIHMTLPVIQEPGDFTGQPAEHCCLCRAHTRFWYQPKDVALCLTCAEAAADTDIPSKADWCAKERELSPQLVPYYQRPL
jgi:hypothetical protein